METLQAQHGDLFARVFLILVTTITILYLTRMLLAPPKRRKDSNSPSLPCPRGLPLIGNLHQLGAVPQDSLAALAAKHAAPLMLLRLGSVPTLIVSTADALRATLQANDRAMSGRPAMTASTRITYSMQDIMFSHPEGVFWGAARRASNSELLSAPRVRSFRDVREGEAAALIAAVEDASRTGSPVNLSEVLMATSNRILRRVAFGDGGEGSIDGFDAGSVLDETQKLLGAFFVSDYMPWLGWLDTLRGLRRRLERNFHELDAFYEKVIDEHLKKPAGSTCEDLVDVLLRLHGDPAYRSTFKSREQIKGIITDLFIAGTDSSAAAVEWTMSELVRHPDVLAKVQREVRGVVAGGSGVVLESDLPRLTYLKQVIRESMRVHPPVPLVPRETIAPCTVSGCEIPAGTRVFVNAMAIGKDPVAWGPDAAAFAPERHEDIAAGLDSFSFAPFGVGRRICPGAHFANSVVDLLLANLLLCFDWRAPPGEVVDLEPGTGITVHRKNPLMLVAERRRAK